MIRKTISMPDKMGEWISERIQNGQYNNESEYFRTLVRKDQAEQDQIVKLRRLLEASEASGISDKTLPEIMTEIEERMRRNGRLSSDQ